MFIATSLRTQITQFTIRRDARHVTSINIRYSKRSVIFLQIFRLYAILHSILSCVINLSCLTNRALICYVASSLILSTTWPMVDIAILFYDNILVLISSYKLYLTEIQIFWGLFKRSILFSITQSTIRMLDEPV